MLTHAGKTAGNKRHADQDARSTQPSGDHSALRALGERREYAAPAKLQAQVNNSPLQTQLKSFQDMANDGPHAKKLAQLRAMAVPSPTGGPVMQLQLATGPYRLKNRFFRTNLRDDTDEKAVSAKLAPRQQLMVIPNGNRVSNFSAGFVMNEHSWVQTQNNGQGWIEDSMLEAAAFFHHAADRGSFLGNLQHRANYLQELETHVNLGSNFDAGTDTLSVANARLQEAAVHLNQGQDAQVAHIGHALNGVPNPQIYDATIANHAAKNALWHLMLPTVDLGVNTTAAPMNNEVKLKTKTALAQIISTAVGYDVLNQVTNLSAVMAIPISYVEQDTQQDYNLFVTPQFGGVNGDILQSLTVTVPPDNLFTDAQSFKRISNPNIAGHSDMGQIGNRISVSPVDTDVLHEFTHALHYLTFEQRRRNAVALQQHDRTDYRVQTGGQGQAVLRNQDNTAESRTIHRNQSFGDLGGLANGIVDPTIPAYQEQADAFGRLGAFTQAIPTENDYRAALGLGARQDHHAMRVTPNGTFQQIGYEPIQSV